MKFQKINTTKYYKYLEKNYSKTAFCGLLDYTVALKENTNKFNENDPLNRFKTRVSPTFFVQSQNIQEKLSIL